MATGLMEPPPPPRWIVGIDLGTTNCSVACIDTNGPRLTVESFLIEQLTDWNTIERKTTLPSFHYVPTLEQLSGCTSKWMSKDGLSHYVVGTIARDFGGFSPGRQTTSAKSWLCHQTADRTASILPWHGDQDISLISPVVASSRYIQHIRLAWDAAHPKDPLKACDVILTLPASFDEVARELTLQAAKLAGLDNLILIEEPQAAFYAWLERVQHASSLDSTASMDLTTSKDLTGATQLDAWKKTIKPGQSVLVCDIGGGTTDLTLIRVKAEKSETESLLKYGLHRVAVGQHLILGGDNLDVALTKVIEPLFTGSTTETLPVRQWEQLRHQCRLLKERLLQDDAPEMDSVSILGSGSRLISSSKSVKVARSVVKEVVLDGFFPKVLLSEQPTRIESGLIEFGLHYANEPAITKHMAAFLWEHRWDGRPDSEKSSLSDLLAARPDWILFNGGVLESSQIRRRLVEQVNEWFPGNDPVGVLPADRLDLAVSIGAAYFGLAKRGLGVRITANLARTYYLKVSDHPPRAVCVMPGDATPLNKFRLSNCPLTLSVGKPVQLQLFVSNTNLVHRVSEVVDIDPLHMLPLVPLATVIQSEKSNKQRELPVMIESSLSEIGTLELAVLDAGLTQTAELLPTSNSPTRWKLAFELRGTTDSGRHIDSRSQIEDASLVQKTTTDQQTITESGLLVCEAFGSKTDSLSKTLMKRIAFRLELPREKWPLSILRAIWQACIDCNEYRTNSSTMESRWLNTVGYCLRPGYGFVSDDWRVAVTWRSIRGKLRYPGNAAESMILWRRVAGGFTQGQQRAIYQEMQGRLRGILNGEASKIRLVADVDEFLRMAGSLELVSNVERTSIGSLAIDSLDNPKLKSFQSGVLWLIGRIGSRIPVYAPVNNVLATEVVEHWIPQLLKKTDLPILAHQRVVLNLARKTGDRYRDISNNLRNQVVRWLRDNNASESYKTLIESAGALDNFEQEFLVGDSLPLGLRLNA